MHSSKTLNLWVHILHKWKMSSFSLLFMLMISSWCVITRTSFCKSKMKDLENWHFFFDMEVERGWITSSLHQPDWVSQKDFQVLLHGGLLSHQSVTWSKTNLKNNMNKDVEMLKFPYQWAVGSLMYAMLYLARFGIPNQHVVNPSLKHWIVTSTLFNTCKAQFKLWFR